MAITSYPDFSRLPDQEIARQLKLIWDALISLSAEIQVVQASIPDTTLLTTQTVQLTKRLSLLESSVLTLI